MSYRIGGAALLVVLAAGCGSAPTEAAPAASAPAASDASARALLPGAQAYVDAVNAGDLEALVASFASDGEIVDVSRRISGHDAIRSWADAEVIGGSLRVDGVTTVAPDQQRVRVHWAPSGSAGWAADYTFTDRDGRITVADLQYAS